MSPETLAFLTTYGIPLLTFVIGHLGLATGLVDKLKLLVRKPTDPTVRPIGQGGVIDLLGLLFAQVVSHPSATAEEKAQAVAAIARVSQIANKPVS